jgi:hypothetical protein
MRYLDWTLAVTKGLALQKAHFALAAFHQVSRAAGATGQLSGLSTRQKAATSLKGGTSGSA